MRRDKPIRVEAHVVKARPEPMAVMTAGTLKWWEGGGGQNGVVKMEVVGRHTGLMSWRGAGGGGSGGGGGGENAIVTADGQWKPTRPSQSTRHHKR